MKNVPWSDYEKEKLRSMKEKGLSVDDIADVFNNDEDCENRSKKSIYRCWDKIKGSYRNIQNSSPYSHEEEKVNNSESWTQYELDKLIYYIKEQPSLSAEDIGYYFWKDKKCHSRDSIEIEAKIKELKKIKDEETIKTRPPLLDYVMNYCKKHKYITKELIMEIYPGIQLPEIMEMIQKANKDSIPLCYDNGNILLYRDYIAQNISSKQNPLSIITDNPKKFSVGIISDTHLGSKAFKGKELNNFYDYLEKNNIQYCLHAGDWVDGMGVYSGQEFEQDCIGFGKQVDFFVDNYPRRKNIKTIGISGNHDYSFITKAGVDILQHITLKREDIINIGAYQGVVNINSVKFMLHHPDGGCSYSLSYRLQKVLETLENNINVFIMGHFHQNILLHGYKSDVALMPGSFQGETSFSIRKGLKNVIGGFILDIDRSSGRIEYTTRWIKL